MRLSDELGNRPMKPVKLLVVAIIVCRTFTALAQTWKQTSAPINNWTSVASSADGFKLVAAASPGGIYTSPDSGNTWSQTSVPANYVYFVASSADGCKLVAVAYGGILISTNSVNTWSIQTNIIQNAWSSVASSADGSKLVAVSPNFGVGSNGEIWTLQTTATPVLNITAANTNLALSWIIPSTNFVLRQCTDLAAGDWSVVTNLPVLNLTNLQNQVTLPLPAGNAFFQLQTP